MVIAEDLTLTKISNYKSFTKNAHAAHQATHLLIINRSVITFLIIYDLLSFLLIRPFYILHRVQFHI